MPVSHRPAGRPDGGQFYGLSRTDASVTLTPDLAADCTDWLARNGLHLVPAALEDMVQHLESLDRQPDDLDRAEALRAVHPRHYGYTLDEARLIRDGIAALRQVGRGQEADTIARLIGATTTAPSTTAVVAPTPTTFGPDSSTLSVGEVPATVTADGEPFWLAHEHVLPDAPTRMRVQIDRLANEDEMIHIRDLLAYRYTQTVGSGRDPIGNIDPDTAFSFIVDVDSSARWESAPRFLDGIDRILSEGSPVRSTDKAGPGTSGTRAIEGFGAGAPKVCVYFNDALHV